MSLQLLFAILALISLLCLFGTLYYDDYGVSPLDDFASAAIYHVNNNPVKMTCLASAIIFYILILWTI